MEEQKVEPETMIDIAYIDCMYDIKHLQIFDCNAFYEEKFSNVKFKINKEKFKELLQHRMAGFKLFEKFAKEKELGENCYIKVRFDGENVFILLNYLKREVYEEVKQTVDGFVKVVLNDFLTLCRTSQITRDDVVNKIESEIKAINPGMEFSMREIFSKYKNLFWDLNDAIETYKIILNDYKSKISQIDKFGDKFTRIQPGKFDFDLF